MTDATVIDYTQMQPGEMLEALGDDAAKWTDAFLQTFPNGCSDWGTMVGWFANAIEQSNAVRAARQNRAGETT